MTELMKTIKFLMFMVFACLLISCAGADVKKAAESEFETGASLLSRGRYEESIPHFEQATVLLPEYGVAYLYLGRAYLNLGKWKEAIGPLKTAYRLAPEETKRETAAIIMDVFFRNADKFDQQSQSEIMDFLQLK